MKRLSAKAPPGGEERRAPNMRALWPRFRGDNLEALPSMDHARQAFIMLEEPERLADLPPSAHYYLGEAYRRRGDPGDVALAE
jgi:hypothetical protein